MKILKLTTFIVIFFASFFLNSCNENNDVSNNQTDTNTQTVNHQALNFNFSFEFINQKQYKCGDSVSISFDITDTIKIDTIVLFVNDILEKKFTNNFDYTFNTENFRVGVQKIKIIVYSDDKQKTIDKTVTLFSDITPKNVGYKVINSYNHDPEAYTQGLFYHEGTLYESTGLETRSSLRKTKVETGEILNSIIIPNNFFGEGIALFNNKIYQITWQDHVAYVLDKETLSIIAEFNYSTEGWGITNDDTHLYMSDGTNNIYIIEPTNFSIVDKIQVFDNEKKIMYLNELEMINGLIYANVYTTDFIVVIDPATGKVLEKINLSGILPNSLKTPSTDVLNGIAYDKQNERIFITGKNWARLFEVEFK
ncbi:MAG: glutaminyl-peptide cyclotransferase [Bacteroidales bacterium]|nr:glutaminyl-peptide cyclotransferase [Bacteroidales bacterium]